MCFCRRAVRIMSAVADRRSRLTRHAGRAGGEIALFRGECFGDMVWAVERCWMKVGNCIVEGKSSTDCSELITLNFWRRLSLTIAA